MNKKQALDKIKTSYPDKVSDYTQELRKNSIKQLHAFIENEIKKNNLKYGVKEERIKLYTSLNNEEIWLQFPGIESIANTRKYPLDARPKMIVDGEELPDMTFENTWDCLSQTKKEVNKVMDIIEILIFRMGRMLDHDFVNKNVERQIIDIKDNKAIKQDTVQIPFYFFQPNSSVIKYLVDKIELITFDNYDFNFDAFLYYFELILMNEDCKYYHRKKNISSGRIRTADTMILLAAHLNGKLSIGSLLQKYVHGNGIANITVNELNNYIENINIFKTKDIIEDYCHKYNITYRFSSPISNNGQRITASIKFQKQKTAIINARNPDKKHIYNLLESIGWKFHFFDETFYDYNKILSILDELNQSNKS